MACGAAIAPWAYAIHVYCSSVSLSAYRRKFEPMLMGMMYRYRYAAAAKYAAHRECRSRIPSQKSAKTRREQHTWNCSCAVFARANDARRKMEPFTWSMTFWCVLLRAKVLETTSSSTSLEPRMTSPLPQLVSVCMYWCFPEKLEEIVLWQCHVWPSEFVKPGEAAGVTPAEHPLSGISVL